MYVAAMSHSVVSKSKGMKWPCSRRVEPGIFIASLTVKYTYIWTERAHTRTDRQTFGVVRSCKSNARVTRLGTHVNGIIWTGSKATLIDTPTSLLRAYLITSSTKRKHEERFIQNIAARTISKITFSRPELTVKWNKVRKQKFANPIWFGASVNIGSIPVISRTNNIKLCMDWM